MVLEKLAEGNGEKAKEKLRSRLKRRLVNGATLVCYSIPVGMGIDRLIGLNLDQSCMARSSAIPLNMLFGDYQTRFTDFARKVFGVTKESHWLKKKLVDNVSVGVFQTGLYLGGVGVTRFFYPEIDMEQFYKSLVVVPSAVFLTGWIHGWLSDEFREIFHVKGYYDKLESQLRKNEKYLKQK